MGKSITSFFPAFASSSSLLFSSMPKKAPARRMSSSHFLDQPWTMVGPLSHRYKQQKWQRLAFCVLAGMRLTAFKSTHSDKPSLAIFLSGYTAIYAERDSGMAHVIKLTHPHQETHVVAADTEEQALSWAEVRVLSKFQKTLRQPYELFPFEK